jgi:hypothetical protein
MRSIWGSSPSDVYVVGHNDQNRGLMWHYNGEKWEDVKLVQMQGGSVVGAIDLTSISGFASNDIWAVGLKSFDVDSSLIIHYDGISWKEMNLPGRGRELISVGGTVPNDIWFGGIDVLYHYDGFSIKHFPIFVPPQGIQFTSIAALSQSEVYMTGYVNDIVQPIDSNFYYLYRFNGMSWSIKDSVIQTYNSPSFGFGDQLIVIDRELYSGGNGVWQWTGYGWNKLFTESWLYYLGGSNENNLFACGGMATLYHYNGSDWKRITLPLSTDVALYGVWTDGREAFIVGHDGNRTFIARGK